MWVLFLLGVFLVIACLSVKAAADSNNLKLLDIWGNIFLVLTLVAIAGLVWDLVYHILLLKAMHS